MTDWCFYFITY